MFIFPISDLHLERRTLPLPEVPKQAEAVICAGDVHEGDPVKTVEALRRLADGRPLVFVPGNHDYYGAPDRRRSIEETDRIFRDLFSKAEGLRMAAGGEAVQLRDGDAEIHVHGSTLWSDWDLAGHWMENGESPFHDDGSLWTREMYAARAREICTRFREAPREFLAIEGWGPYAATSRHAFEKGQLLDGMAELARSNGSVDVVVSHHPPFAAAVDDYRGHPAAPWWTPAFYVSRVLEDLSDALRPKLWISGHVHRRHDAAFGRTRALSNPLEAPDFDPALVVEIVPDPRPEPVSPWLFGPADATP